MKRFITIIIFIIIINFIVPQALAANSTPSAEVKTKLQALQAEIASKAAKIKQEIGRKLQNKVYAGFIKSKSTNSITLATTEGSRIININEYTIYQAQNLPTSKTGKQNSKSLSTDDYILALGDIDDTAVLTAKKVIKTASPSAGERKVVFGEVISSGDQTVTIRGKDGQNIPVSVDGNTNYSFGKNSGSFEEIKANKPIIVVGANSQGNILQARFIYIFPYTANIKLKVASPSAVSTSSAKKK